jgi:hypothetical protein
MKQIKRNPFRLSTLLGLTLLGLLSVATSACSEMIPAPAVAAPSVSPIASASYADVLSVTESTAASVDLSAAETTVNSITVGGLSDAEVEGLLYMREEEKLARDVYLSLYAAWEIPIFQNIASSEQQHMDAVKRLLDEYGLQDPAAGQAPGAFVNPELQKLYDQLVEQGSQSLADALRAGAAIEEIDILDLEARAGQTDNAAIQQVYANLMKGSRNHLRSFVSTLERQTGETYQPQYLESAEYAMIVSTPRERGRASGS